MAALRPAGLPIPPPRHAPHCSIPMLCPPQQFPRVVPRKEREEDIQPEENPRSTQITKEGNECTPRCECDFASAGAGVFHISHPDSGEAQNKEDRAHSLEEGERPSDEYESEDCHDRCIDGVPGIQHHEHTCDIDHELQEDEENRASCEVIESGVEEHDCPADCEQPIFDRKCGMTYRALRIRSTQDKHDCADDTDEGSGVHS